ncbi:MAG TPA: hypothetical protein VHT70_00800 [Candidatus Saccharimonadales bacterium]|nr:hypothetical protein [Candidatus Saccharimonadales bacterium]
MQEFVESRLQEINEGAGQAVETFNRNQALLEELESIEITEGNARNNLRSSADRLQAIAKIAEDLGAQMLQRANFIPQDGMLVTLDQIPSRPEIEPGEEVGVLDILNKRLIQLNKEEKWTFDMSPDTTDVMNVLFMRNDRSTKLSDAIDSGYRDGLPRSAVQASFRRSMDRIRGYFRAADMPEALLVEGEGSHVKYQLSPDLLIRDRRLPPLSDEY